MSISSKVVNGISWRLVENLSRYGMHFVFGIIMARLLSPSDYGITGMIAIFLAISNTLSEGGFQEAIIRKQHTTEDDHCTVFYTNIGFSLLLYSILYFLAPTIAQFYDRPELLWVTRVTSVNILITAMGRIEMSLLTREMQFKKLMNVSLSSEFLASLIGVVLAFLGFGYWALIFRTLAQNTIRVVILYVTARWIPSFRFSIESFKEFFSFGYKVTLSNLINTIYDKIYYVIIGRYFAADQLGYYTRAEGYSNMFSNTITTMVKSVTFPALCQVNNKGMGFVDAFRKVLRLTFYAVCISIAFAIGSSNELIVGLIGTKWIQAVPYLRITSMTALMFPLRGIHGYLFPIINRTDIQLKLQIVEKIAAIPFIVIGVLNGMMGILWCLFFHALLSYAVRMIITSRLIDYPIIMQLKDLLPSLLMGLSMVVVLLPLGDSVASSGLTLVIKLLTSILVTFSIGMLFKLKEFMELSRIIQRQFRHIRLKLKQ